VPVWSKIRNLLGSPLENDDKRFICCVMKVFVLGHCTQFACIVFKVKLCELNIVIIIKYHRLNEKARIILEIIFVYIQAAAA